MAMKRVILVARILLGLVFVFFGANAILHFFHAPAFTGDAGQLSEIMERSKWMTFVGLVQVVGGILLLVGRYVPLGLTLLAPVIVNILLFHLLLLGGAEIVPPLVVAVLEVFLIWAYRGYFRTLLGSAHEVS